MGGDVRRTGARPRAGREATDLEALAGHVEAELRATAELATRTADTLSGAVAELAVMVVETLASGGRLLFCGNGGSAADAQHLAAEYVVRFGRQREALPALALTADACVLTASGNDFGFEEVFARQIEGLGAPGDLLVLHSTSGASPNLSRAAAAARARGVRSVALLASGGGTLKDEVDLAIVLPTENTARAQEIQLAIGHAVAEWVDRQWAGRDRGAD